MKLVFLKSKLALRRWFPLIDKLACHQWRISTLNSECEADSGHKIKRCRPDDRASVFIFDHIEDVSVNPYSEKW